MDYDLSIGMTESAVLAHTHSTYTSSPAIETQPIRSRKLPTVLLAALVGLTSDIIPHHRSAVVPIIPIRPAAAVAAPSPTWVEAPPPLQMSIEEVQRRIQAIVADAQYIEPLEESVGEVFYKKFISDGRTVEMISFVEDGSRNEEILSFLDEHFSQVFKQGSPARTDINRWTDFRVIVVDDFDSVSYPQWDDQSRQNLEDPFVITTHFSAQPTVVLRFNNSYSPGPANRWVTHHFRERAIKPAA